jgi:hypothetical protein
LHGQVWLHLTEASLFTRERSKVRSLVRPPSSIIFNNTLAAPSGRRAQF